MISYATQNLYLQISNLNFCLNQTVLFMSLIYLSATEFL